jgi:transcription initiation factor TFIIIB Brf1 subunit/transcription initiation factor TFIIB
MSYAGRQSPEDLLEQVAADAPEDVLHRALALAEADSAWEGGATAKGVAAAALYAAWLDQRPRAKAGEGRPRQTEVAAQFDTNVVTLRQRFRDLPEGV